MNNFVNLTLNTLCDVYIRPDAIVAIWNDTVTKYTHIEITSGGKFTVKESANEVIRKLNEAMANEKT